MWEVPCELAFPSATLNELTRKLVAGGCIAVAEGSNMPCTPDAVKVFHDASVLFGLSKAANAGGVAVSALEMQQNASRDTWTFEYTEERLEQIMQGIHRLCSETAKAYGSPGNYVRGANMASYIRVAKAMLSLGLA